MLSAMFWKILFCLVVLMCVSDGKNIGKKKNYLDEEDYARARNTPKTQNKGAQRVLSNDILGLNPDTQKEDAKKLNELEKELSEKHKEWAKGNGMKRVRRSAELTAKLWPRVNDLVRVPYTLSSIYSDEERAIIAGAMAEIARYTCIKFVRKETTDNNYIVIEERTGWGCKSYRGMQGGNQTLTLARSPPEDTCVYHSMVQHELLHALGFFHEHSRTDRDQYVTINWDNVIPEEKKEFYKFDKQMLLGTKYDIHSVTHYHATAYSKNGKPTIEAKEAGIEEVGELGQLSQTDITDINRLYGCACVVWSYGPDCYGNHCNNFEDKSKLHCSV